MDITSTFIFSSATLVTSIIFLIALSILNRLFTPSIIAYFKDHRQWHKKTIKRYVYLSPNGFNKLPSFLYQAISILLSFYLIRFSILIDFRPTLPLLRFFLVAAHKDDMLLNDCLLLHLPVLDT